MRAVSNLQKSTLDRTAPMKKLSLAERVHEPQYRRDTIPMSLLCVPACAWHGVVDPSSHDVPSSRAPPVWHSVMYACPSSQKYGNHMGGGVAEVPCLHVGDLLHQVDS